VFRITPLDYVFKFWEINGPVLDEMENRVGLVGAGSRQRTGDTETSGQRRWK